MKKCTGRQIIQKMYREADILIIASQQGDHQYIRVPGGGYTVPGGGYIYNLPARDRFFDEKVQDKYIHFTIFSVFLPSQMTTILIFLNIQNKVGIFFARKDVKN